jgi:uncharacterized protein (DUF2252 family)
MTRNIIERIQRFNQGRDPDRLFLKYEKMRVDSFAFFRGTCHLFYEDWADASAHSARLDRLNAAPPVWICGDLHLENFGSYKGDDRQVYFDINDFDEAALAPCTWELARFLSSVFVAAYTLGLSLAEAKDLCEAYLQAYTRALANGKARSVETDTADGMIEELLEGLKQRDRSEFLNRRTAVKKDGRQIEVDGERTVPITEEERSQIEHFLSSWAAGQRNPEFFELLDASGRLAGTGSLGVKRYLLLVRGKGSPNRNYLLDLKQSQVSSLQPYLSIAQPHWADEASRIVEIQTRVQATAPALLHAVTFENQSFVLKELQPTQDKLSLHQWNGKISRLEKVMQTMGRITAWGQLRSGGRDESAIADELIDFGQSSDWHDPLLEYAQDYARQAEEDYECFREQA